MNNPLPEKGKQHNISKCPNLKMESKQTRLDPPMLWSLSEGLLRNSGTQRGEEERGITGPSSGWRCVHKVPWRKVWGTKKVSTFTCLARLLPGIISLLLISQVFSEALTLWGSPNAWDVCHKATLYFRRDVTEKQASQRSCLRVMFRVPEWRRTGHQMPNVWMLLNFADTELKLPLLSQS